MTNEDNFCNLPYLPPPPSTPFPPPISLRVVNKGVLTLTSSNRNKTCKSSKVGVQLVCSRFLQEPPTEVSRHRHTSPTACPPPPPPGGWWGGGIDGTWTFSWGQEEAKALSQGYKVFSLQGGSIQVALSWPQPRGRALTPGTTWRWSAFAWQNSEQLPRWCDL